ncbi:ABC transporter ATP-binding protein [Nesterenkonia alba]|uniref:ABC transporter ATP-binding protein n=1 Tax=Nesterenkonia alba TaxID=515814 RepID=UPI000406D5BE|nr:ABC transporter ATP-binding protein [Nesterenkonia alba]
MNAEQLALDIQHLKISYGPVEVIRGVDIQVQPGEKIGIVGESGSGKSTVALGVMGLLAEGGRITDGSISIAGKPVNYEDEKRLNAMRGKDVSLVFQDPLSSLDPVKSIGNQIAEAIRWHNPRMSRREIRDRAIQLLTAVGVPDPAGKLSQYPHEYSGGMRQRVLIAIAIANDPAVLIADEPTTALDVTTQAQVMELLDSLVERLGIAVVLVTHDIGVVAEFCDRVLVMYSGRVVEQVRVEDIFDRAAHPYTAALLDSLPSRAAEAHGELKWIPGSPPPMTDVPPGCAFAPRCHWAVEECSVQPAARVIDAQKLHTAECHRAEEVQAASRQAGGEKEAAHA